MKIIYLFILINLVSCTTLEDKAKTDWISVPALFECDRIYLKNQSNNKTNYFFTDSGGGLSPFSYYDVVSKWNISSLKLDIFKEEGAA